SLDPLFDGIRASMAATDIAFANLETTLVAPDVGETRRGALQLRGEPDFARSLRRAGITVVNVANNHASQHGDDTFHATVGILQAAGIACCGQRGSDGWASQPAFLHEGAVGVLGYSLRPRQYASHVPPYAEGTSEEIRNDVRRLRAMGAAVIVSL